MLFLLLVAFGVLSGHTRADDRPNVIMAFADDWGRYAGAYADLNPGGISDAVSTPHFDRVASEGLLFTRAFVSAPSCTPCRSSLLSGQHFWRCGRGAILRGAIWDFSSPSYPLLMKDAGYRIGHTYKVWSPGTPADAPHGGKATGFNSAGRKFNAFSQTAMKSDDHEAAMKQLYDEVRQNFLSFVDADGNGKLDGDQPFCYWFGPTNCHRKWIAGSGKALWGIDPDSLKGKLPKYLPDVPTIREDFADYLGEVQAFDAGLGVIMEEMTRLGLDKNTILVVSGDHGMPGVSRGKCNLYDMGTHVPLAIRWPERISNPGRVIDDFVSLPDLATTFLEVSDVEIPDTMTATSLVPIFKSEQAGQVIPERGAVFTGRERHVDHARIGNKPYPQRAIRTDEYLYVVNFEPDRWPMGTAPGYGEPGELSKADDFQEALTENTFAGFGDMDASPTKAWIITHRRQDPKSFDYAVGKLPEFELYNVKSDPDCMVNLASKLEHQETRNKLHLRLMEELHRTKDPRVSDDPIFESSPYTDLTRPKGK
ncbi:sulfatase [Rubripirellula amarantea]|nr:sulfatase [Rubripirellula amarantea]